MKKLFFVILMATALISCGKEGPRGPQGRDGRDGRDGKDGSGVQINTYYFEAFPNQWNKNGEYGSPGYYCFVEKQLKDLTFSVIDQGAILAYIILNDYDNQLPYIEPRYDGGYYIRTIRYDLQEGKIGFIVEDSDFKTLLPPFSNMVKFKVVIISKI